MEISNYQIPDAGDIEPALEKFKKEHYPNEQEFPSALASYGISEQDIKDELLWQRAVLLFINARFRPSVNVGEKEIEEYFQKEVAAARAARPGEPVDLDELRSQIQESIIEKRVDEAMSNFATAFDQCVTYASGFAGDAHALLAENAALRQRLAELQAKLQPPGRR